MKSVSWDGLGNPHGRFGYQEPAFQINVWHF
jgi:hypothetical protein